MVLDKNSAQLLKDRESLKFPFYLARTSADDNCLYNACSLALADDESLAMCLRCLTSIELFMNAEYYASHNVYLNGRVLKF